MAEYESMLQLLGTVPSAASADVRDVKWATDSHIVGFSRDHEGRVELFLSGAELQPFSIAVSDAIDFRSWHRDGAPPFDANRLVFPALGHFDQVAAFICTELLRAGADSSLESAFAQTEPIIELVIERLRLSTQAILGLAGELLLLDALVRVAAREQTSSIIASWSGWRRSSRDFSLGSTGVEVKTTTGSDSSHMVDGLHQVELSDGAGGESPEQRLLLVSIGLQHAQSDTNAFTIPQLVDRVIARMAVAGLGETDIDRFLTHLAEYGEGLGMSYEHGAPTSGSVYAAPFVTAFFRGYDMTDGAIETLRRRDVIERRHVDVSSVRFRLDLPSVASLGNPVLGANQVARIVLGNPE